MAEQFRPNYSEARIMDLLLEGARNLTIAQELGCGESNVEYHLTQLFRATGTTNRWDLAEWWRERRHLYRYGEPEGD